MTDGHRNNGFYKRGPEVNQYAGRLARPTAGQRIKELERLVAKLTRERNALREQLERSAMPKRIANA